MAQVLTGYPGGAHLVLLGGTPRGAGTALLERTGILSSQQETQCFFCVSSRQNQKTRFFLKSFEKLHPDFRKERGHMVGFISNLAPLLNYLRRRSPGPRSRPTAVRQGNFGAINITVAHRGNLHPR